MWAYAGGCWVVAAELSGDRVSSDGRNETVSLIMTVFPTPGPGELGTRHGCLRLRLACPVLAPAPVSGEPGHPVTVTRPGTWSLTEISRQLDIRAVTCEEMSS